MLYTYLYCFFIYAFLGWCGEVLFAAAVEKRFVNRGFLNGPVCPIYGVGVALIAFFMRPFAGNLLVLFLGSMILGTMLEWVAGFLLEKIFHQKWWDYSDDPHNLNGYVCLKFSVVWGFAGAFVVRFVVPATSKLVNLLPRALGWVLLSVLGGLIITDLAVTVVAIIGLNRKLKMLELVAARLKEGSDKLGEDLYEHALSAKKRAEVMQMDAEKLHEKYEQNLHSNVLHRRLLKAFPDLKSAKHSEQLEALQNSLNVFRSKSKHAIERRNQAAVQAYEPHLAEGQEKPFAYMICYEKLFWIFMAGNVVGCLLETVYALIMPPHQFELRVSVVLGPFILVYGFGAVLLTLFLRKMYNQRDVLIFIASMVVGAAFEYLCSFMQQAAFGTVSWEYSNSPFNVGGRINLMYSIFWGILGLVWVKDLYPVVSRRLEQVPKRLGRILTVIFTVFMVIDMGVSAGAVYRQYERVEDIPATNGVQEFFDKAFPDEVLAVIYPHMQYVGRLELPEKLKPESGTVG